MQEAPTSRQRDSDDQSKGDCSKHRRRDRDEADYAEDFSDDGDHVNMAVDNDVVINKSKMYVLDGGCSISQTHIKTNLNISLKRGGVEVNDIKTHTDEYVHTCLNERCLKPSFLCKTRADYIFRQS